MLLESKTGNEYVSICVWFSHISRLSCGDAEKNVTICKCILVLFSFADILSMEKELHC